MENWISWMMRLRCHIKEKKRKEKKMVEIVDFGSGLGVIPREVIA